MPGVWRISCAPARAGPGLRDGIVASRRSELPLRRACGVPGSVVTWREKAWKVWTSADARPS